MFVGNGEHSLNIEQDTQNSFKGRKSFGAIVKVMFKEFSYNINL